MALDLKSTINALRVEINRLHIDLGVQNEWPPMKVPEKDFNQELLKQHDKKKKELANEWMNIAGSLDDLFEELEDGANELQQRLSDLSKKSSTMSLPSEEKIFHKADFDKNSIYQWKADGKEYRLLTEQELAQNKEKYETQREKYRDDFREFKKNMRERLSYNSENTPDPSLESTPVMRGLVEKTEGAAWMYQFIGSPKGSQSGTVSPKNSVSAVENFML